MNAAFINSTAKWTVQLAILAVLKTAAHSEEPSLAWCFQLKGQPVAYIKQPNGDWLFVQRDKPANVLVEIESSADALVLQNKRTKLLIKLTETQSYWRQPSQDKWTNYARGAYGVPPPLLLRTINNPSPPSPRPSPGETSPNPKAPPLNRTMSEHRYEVRVAYFVPADRQPVNSWREKIDVVVRFADSMYRNDLRAKRFETPGLSWQRDDGTLKVNLIRGKYKAAHYATPPTYDDRQQFARVAEEVVAHIGKRDEAVGLVFCENYDETPSKTLWNGAFALGAYHSAKGGLAMFSAHLLKDEFCATTVPEQLQKFFDPTPVPGRAAMGHRINSPRREFTEDGFGAVIHELGHALGLPHDFRDHQRFVMSNGFRQISRNLSDQTPASSRVTFSDYNTQLLMCSRYLNPRIDRTDDEPPAAELEILDANPATHRLRVRFSASDDKELRMYTIFDKNAQTLIDGGKLAGQQRTQTSVVQAKPDAGKYRLTLIVCDQGGNQRRIDQRAP